MLKGFTIWPVLLLSIVACSPDESSEKSNLLEDRTFVHLFFSSEQECLEAQPEPDFFHNCHQEVNFFGNNEVTIMLTDVWWKGKYTIQEKRVILSFEPNYEIPDGKINFELVEEGKLLKLDNSTIWKEIHDDDIWQ